MKSIFLEIQVPELIEYKFRTALFNPFEFLALSLTIDTDAKAKLVQDLIAQVLIQSLIKENDETDHN